jgi:salicylate hydroxylase
VYPDIQLSSSNNIYRAVIDGSILQKNPRLASLLDEGNIWWGPGRCIVGIPIQRKAFYALSCTHPGDTGTAGEWNKRGDLNQMKATYSDFEPRIRELIEHVNPETLLVWKLTQLPELDSWVFGSGRVVLIGDGKTP